MSDSSSTTHSDGRQSSHQDTETMTSASSISTQESEAETESTIAASTSSEDTFEAPTTPSVVGTEDEAHRQVNGETEETRESYGLLMITSREEPTHRLHTPGITPRPSQASLFSTNNEQSQPEPRDSTNGNESGNENGGVPRGESNGSRRS